MIISTKVLAVNTKRRFMSKTTSSTDMHPSLSAMASPPKVVVSEDTLAMRLEQIIGSESVASFARRSGVGESLLRKYLKGAQPNAQNLVLLADAGGASVDWLAAGRFPRMRAEMQSNISDDPIVATGNDEFKLITCYRQASPDQKAAVNALLEAIAHPGGIAWFRVGEAVARIANIFPRK